MSPDFPPVRDAGAIWRQCEIPVLYRDTEARRLLLKLPYAPENRQWIQSDKSRNPEWLKRWQCWQIPQRWFNEMVLRLLGRFGSVYLIQPYREQEQCAPACWNAEGFDCACSCLGANHGQSAYDDDWIIDSETFAIRWGDKQLGCRFLTLKYPQMYDEEEAA